MDRQGKAHDCIKIHLRFFVLRQSRQDEFSCGNAATKNVEMELYQSILVNTFFIFEPAGECMNIVVSLLCGSAANTDFCAAESCTKAVAVQPN